MRLPEVALLNSPLLRPLAKRLPQGVADHKLCGERPDMPCAVRGQLAEDVFGAAAAENGRDLCEPEHVCQGGGDGVDVEEVGAYCE